MSITRNYNCKDVDMFTSIKTIAGYFIANISDLSALRGNWTPDYANALDARITEAMSSYLGSDAKKGLRTASADVEAIQTPAKRDLSFFKTQVEEDFKKEPARSSEILKTLGFDKNIKGVQKGNQESLTELLFTFKKNITAELRLILTAKGMNGILIDRIIGYADIFFAANTTQEGQKTASKEITSDTISTFNDLYGEVITICKYASDYYKDDPVKKEQFTFSKVLAKLGSSPKAETATSTSTTPAQ